MKTIVYVDGYNLYYGLLRNSPHKWLDLFSLFQHQVLTMETEITDVRFYTARVLPRLCSDPESPNRQRVYLKALQKMPPGRVTIIEGKMELSKQHVRLVRRKQGYLM